MNDIPVAFEATIVTVNDKPLVMFMALKKLKFICVISSLLTYREIGPLNSVYGMFPG